MSKVWTEQRIASARQSLAAWHGTPHHNRIAIRKVGVDCIKLVYKVIFEAGIFPDVDFHGYSVDDGMSGESTKLQETILHCCYGEVVFGDYEFGDIAIFKTGDRSAHCGFFSGDGYLWHSLARRCVTRSDFSLWRGAVVCAVRLTGEGFRVSPAKLFIK